jgi:hypothetical protein
MEAMRQVGTRALSAGRAARWLFSHAILGLILGMAGVASGTIAALEARDSLTGRVVRVMDGETIAVRVDKKVLTVRYIGIHTRDARMPADSMIAGPPSSTVPSCWGRPCASSWTRRRRTLRGAPSRTCTWATSW